MFRYVFVFWLAAMFGPSSFSPLQEDVGAVLARSEALYYEAKYTESIAVLTALDNSLKSSTVSVEQKAKVKFQLALAYFAMNEVGKAKAHIGDMCALNPKCSIDPQNYPPKVLALFDTAKEEYEKNAAEQLYQQGMEAYKRNELAEAMTTFREALRRDPEHAFAAQYLALTHDMLRFAVNQKVLDWRREFNAGNLALASAGYRQLVALNVEGVGDAALDQIRTEVRKVVTPSVEAWKRACGAGDAVTMNQVRSRAAEMLPDPAIGQDLLDQMSICTVKPCVNLDANAAMLRVRTSTRPEIPSSLLRTLKNSLGQTVRVQVKIDEKGDVSVFAARGDNAAINDAVRRAVEKWKFSPFFVEGEPRCVETVFPIGVTSSGPN